MDVASIVPVADYDSSSALEVAARVLSPLREGITVRVRLNEVHATAPISTATNVITDASRIFS